MSLAASSPCPPLRVADHVRSRVVGNQVILLDLKRNRYLGLNSLQWQAVLAALTKPGTGPSSEPDRDVAKLIDGLHRNRILTNALPGRHEEPALPPANTSIDLSSPSQHSTNRPHLRHFIGATLQAALWLRFRSLNSVVRSVEKLHRTCEPVHLARADALHSAIAAFNHLRPLAFTSKDKCLFDSLALTLFLARQGWAVRWVIGVTTQPFAAHSWVQDGTEVLNDLHERVGRFQPLLVV